MLQGCTPYPEEFVREYICRGYWKDQTLGDLLDKPVAKGGLDFSRFTASAILFVAIAGCILVFPQRAGKHSGKDEVLRS